MLHGFLPIVGMLLVAAVVIAVVKGLLASKGGQVATFPYQKETHLFSPAERSFLGILERALGDTHRVMGKVRLADVIRLQTGVNGKGWQSAFNRIQSKHVDFVVCDAKTLAVQYVIELDDQSHGRAKRQGRDEFVNKALRAAGVPLCHFSAKRSYAVPEVQKLLLARGSTPQEKGDGHQRQPDGHQPD